MLNAIAGFAAGRRSKWVVLFVWLALAFALGPLQSKLQDSTLQTPEAFLPRSAEATDVEELLKDRFPGANYLTATVVLATPADAPLTLEQRRYIGQLPDRLRREGELEDATRPVAPFGPDGKLLPGRLPASLVSPDRSAALVVFAINGRNSDVLRADVKRVRGELQAGQRSSESVGLVANLGGVAALTADAVDVFGSVDQTLLTATLILLLILLLFVYRSPIVAFVPLLVVGLAYSIAAGVIYTLVDGGHLEVTGQSTGILIVLMFGAGTDYCLLITSRCREYLSRSDDQPQAVIKAASVTAPTIISAGATVLGGMLVLSLADVKSTQNLSVVLGIGIAVAVLAGLTLLPAILAILGRRAFWPFQPSPARPERPGTRRWQQIGEWVSHHPDRALIASVVVLALGALGNLQSAEKLSFGQGFRDEPDSAEASERIRERFPQGLSGTSTAITRTDAAPDVTRALASAPDVAAVQPQRLSRDGQLTALTLVLSQDPFSEEAADSVPRLREIARGAAGQTPVDDTGEPVLIGGVSAQNHDTYSALSDDAHLIVPAVLAVVLLVLIVLLRALVAPLYLIATVVLSYACALGLSKLIVVNLLGYDAIEPSLPIISFIFLVALGIDYNIFLMARIREEFRHGPDGAVVRALTETGSVITSAGVILAGTFLTLTILPLQSLTEIGLTVAIGLLIDAFLVRSILVPAIALKLGNHNWWPSGSLPVDASRARPE